MTKEDLIKKADHISDELLEEMKKGYVFDSSKEKDILLYETAYSYFQQADISHFESGSIQESEANFVNEEKEFCAHVVAMRANEIEDADGLNYDESKCVKINGEDYIYINWGEDEVSLIKESAMREYIHIVYESTETICEPCRDGEYETAYINFTPTHNNFIDTLEEAEKLAKKAVA